MEAELHTQNHPTDPPPGYLYINRDKNYTPQKHIRNIQLKLRVKTKRTFQITHADTSDSQI